LRVPWWERDLDSERFAGSADHAAADLNNSPAGQKFFTPKIFKQGGSEIFFD